MPREIEGNNQEKILQQSKEVSETEVKEIETLADELKKIKDQILGLQGAIDYTKSDDSLYGEHGSLVKMKNKIETELINKSLAILKKGLDLPHYTGVAIKEIVYDNLNSQKNRLFISDEEAIDVDSRLKKLNTNEKEYLIAELSTITK